MSNMQRISKKDARTIYNTEALFSELKRYEAIINYCNKVLENNPKFAEAWVVIGLILYKLEKKQEAINCLDKALEINPEFAESWIIKGLVLYELERYEEAINCFNKAIRYYNKTPPLFLHVNEPARLKYFCKKYKESFDYNPIFLYVREKKPGEISELLKKIRDSFDKALEIDSSEVCRENLKLSDKFAPTKLGNGIRGFEPTSFKSGFIGENLSLNEYSSLSEKEKIDLDSTLWKYNEEWINNKFKKLNADWIIVIDGEVEKYSSTIDEYPTEEQILEICEKKKKFPFIFINERILAIEESSSFKWSKTTGLEDYYPTIGFQISSLNEKSKINIIGDFDTGAPNIYISSPWLESNGLITKPPLKTHSSMHLNKQYQYFITHFYIELMSENNEIKREKFGVVCILNWDKSAFVEINPNRIALIGRSVLLKLKPTILLKFSNHTTEIFYEQT